jgi:hypothetical protein
MINQTITFAEDTTVCFVVAGAGTLNGDQDGSSGGGGSFVFVPGSDDPLLVAGGGGGELVSIEQLGLCLDSLRRRRVYLQWTGCVSHYPRC